MLSTDRHSRAEMAPRCDGLDGDSGVVRSVTERHICNAPRETNVGITASATPTRFRPTQPFGRRSALEGGRVVRYAAPPIVSPLGSVETERLLLRRFEATDLDSLAAVFGHAEVWRYPYGRGVHPGRNVHLPRCADAEMGRGRIRLLDHGAQANDGSHWIRGLVSADVPPGDPSRGRGRMAVFATSLGQGIRQRGRHGGPR